MESSTQEDLKLDGSIRVTRAICGCLVMIRRQIIIFGLVVLFAGCDTHAWLQQFVPKEEDSFARGFIDWIRQGQYAASEEMVDPNVRPEFTRDAFEQMRLFLNRGDPLSVETVGYQKLAQDIGYRSSLTYQIQFSDSWILGEVVIEKTDSKLSVLGIHFEPLAASLAKSNGFTFENKSPGHVAFLVVQLLLIGFSICVAVLAWKSNIKRKWLWIIVTLVGIVQVNLNWTSGELDFRIIDVRIPVASAMKMGPYAPWILSFELPMGAILFLVKRKRLEQNYYPRIEESGADIPPSGAESGGDASN